MVRNVPTPERQSLDAPDEPGERLTTLREMVRRFGGSELAWCAGRTVPEMRARLRMLTGAD